MQNIIEFIKNQMAARGMTYELLATKTGMSRQNLWSVLNKRACPNLETVKKILSGMDYVFMIEKKKDCISLEKLQEQFFDVAEEEQVSYEAAKKLLAVIGYDLIVVDDNLSHE